MHDTKHFPQQTADKCIVGTLLKTKSIF